MITRNFDSWNSGFWDFGIPCFTHHHQTRLVNTEKHHWKTWILLCFYPQQNYGKFIHTNLTEIRMQLNSHNDNCRSIISAWSRTFSARRTGPFLSCPGSQFWGSHLSEMENPVRTLKLDRKTHFNQLHLFPGLCILCSSKRLKLLDRHRWHTCLDRIRNCIRRRSWPKYRDAHTNHRSHIFHRISRIIGRSLEQKS